MSDLVIEIGCEDLPAVACREAERQVPELLAAGIDRAGLYTDGVAVHVSPRRIAAIATGLPAERGAARTEIRGPRADAPEAARAGFARKHGVEVTDLEEREGLLWVISDGAATPVDEVVPELVSGLVSALNFSKSMRWDHGRFSRPVRWLVVKVDDRVVPVELFGLVAGGVSRGHRFLAGPVEVASATTYRDDLRGARVLVAAEERRALIEAGLDAAGEWIDPLRKLDEVVYLAEWPSVLTGRIDERFLALPERVVITAMQSHQRYFPLRSGDRLEPRFLFVANGGDPETVIRGNEEVLVGRLTDAEFAHATDLERGIEAMFGELHRVSFLEGSGSIADKTARVMGLADQLSTTLGTTSAVRDAAVKGAEFSKADLVSNLVGEFSDLEGYAGSVYARAAGIDAAAATAIEEHHLPYGFAGALPQSDAGAIVSVADKVDTLAVAFGLGIEPTGSRDPYGLRRAAAGLVAVVLDRGWRIGIAGLLPEDGVSFVLDRVEAALIDEDVTREEVRAARGSGEAEPVGVAERARALRDSRGPGRDAIRDAYSRSRRIAGDAPPVVDAAALGEPAERGLWDALGRLERPRSGATVAAALTSAGELVDPVNRFFDEILVMDPDEHVRATRLGLVASAAAALREIADFDELPG